MIKKRFYVVECSKNGGVTSRLYHVNYEALPEFVKNKESKGYQVYVHTEVYFCVVSEDFVFPSYFMLDYSE